MRLSKIGISNFRSFLEAKDIRIEPLQAFVGENNSGKSNVLRAIKCFLSSGSGGATPNDFQDRSIPISIECEFSDLSPEERKKLKTYIIGDRVLLRKELKIVTEELKSKTSVKAEYHGYTAEPKKTCYSLKKIEDESGNKANWSQLAQEGGFEELARNEEGKINKSSFKLGLEKFIEENDIEFETPSLGETQALGIPQNLLSLLPEFYLLPAITDYSNEIDKRSTSTVFRQLVGDLSERLLQLDPRYQEIKDALTTIKALLNVPDSGSDPTKERLSALAEVETELRELVKGLMPSVEAVSLSVEIEDPKEIFAKGIGIKVHDGVETDVLDKGNGMQRSLVFALLQMLIKSKRQTGDKEKSRPILLAIEEPELYIHPHAQRLIFSVLKGFADPNSNDNHQVIYTTHSPALIEVGHYERVAVLRKTSKESGSKVYQCLEGALGSLTEKQGFKLLTSFGLRHNELFFARDVVLVEGPEDEVAIISTARKLGIIQDLPDEIGLSIIVAEGKGQIAKFEKVLNAFGIPFGVLLELDGKPESDKQTAPIIDNLNGNRIFKVPKSLEDYIGLNKHFDDQLHAKSFFSTPGNIKPDLEKLVTTLIGPKP